MLSFIALLASLYALFRLGQVESKLEELKNNKQSGNTVFATPLPSVQSETMVVMQSEKVAANISAIPSPEKFDSTPGVIDSFISWLQKDFLVKLGAFLLIIALGWFVSYAFANNWIGPVGRITVGILLGASFIVGGTMRAMHSSNQGGIFAVLGSAIVLLTVYAAREMYDMFTPITALFVMFMSVVFVARLAVVHRLPSVAVSGLLMAAGAPFLTNSPEASVMMLFSYLAVIILGSLWVLYLMQARILMLLGLFIVFMYSAPYMSESGSEAALALVFGFFFTAVFFFANIISFVRHKDAVSYVNYIVAIGTGLYLMSWIGKTSALDESWKGLVYMAWSLVFAYGSFIVFSIFKDRRPFYTFSSVGIALLAAATATVFEGDVLTIVYAVEVTLLVVLVARLLGDLRVAAHTAWLYAVPILMSLDSLDWPKGTVLSDESFVFVTLIVSLSVGAHVLYDQYKEREVYVRQMGAILISLVGVYIVSFIWLATHSILPYETATMISLFVYMVSGIALFVEGTTNGSSALRTAGGILIALVVGRLLLIEVWDMTIAGKIVIFTIIGVMLISTAFIKKLQSQD
jgi:uncharacterized membrane protein